jgi:hypothetical protein
MLSEAFHAKKILTKTVNGCINMPKFRAYFAYYGLGRGKGGVKSCQGSAILPNV